MNKSVIIITVLVTILLLGGAAFLLTRPPQETTANLDEFAQCLAEKQVTMYGAYWCSHCQAQKKLFGASFQYVPYVECTVEIQNCTDHNVQGYPTWIFADGSRIEGEAKLSQLAAKTSCQLPE